MSVQLIEKDSKTGLLSLKKDGLDVFQNITGNIGICLIVGPYRQGKSFLMNRLISNEENTFTVGNTDDSCTKGIWISKKPLKLSNNNYVIFADTEGLDSDECDEAWDTKLFLLSLSICSVFIYNTKNALSNDAFNKLSVMANLSERIKIKSNVSSVFNKINLKQDCPKFVWIVRDYSLQQSLKPNERLNKFLEMEREEGNSGKKLDDIKTRNEIKESMIKLFKSFDCFYLKTPEYDGPLKKNLSQFLQSLNNTKFDEISKEFRDEFEEIRTFLYKNIGPKEINNETIKGEVFCKYLKNLVKLINSDECINLHDILTESVKAVAENTLSEAKKRYITEMENLFNRNKKCLKEQDLFNNESVISKNVINWMLSNITGSKNLAKNFADKFEEFRQIKDQYGKLKGGKLFEYKERNEKLADSYNNEALENSKKKYSDEMNTFMASNLPKKWNDFYAFENDLSIKCINSMNDILITSNKSKYENNFNQFKGEKSYDNKPYSGELVKFYKKNEMSILDKNKEIATNLWDSMKINRSYSKKADFLYALESFKSSVISKLFECTDFDTFWTNFKDNKNVDGIMNSITETLSSSSYNNLRSNDTNDWRQLANLLKPIIGFSNTSQTSHLADIVCSKELDESCKCPICGLVCKNEHGLSIHMGRMHKESDSEPENFECPYCSRSFTTQRGLNIHIGKIH